MPRSALAGSGRQPSLFDPVEPPRAPFARGSRTSRAAAAAVAPRMAAKRRRVHHAYVAAGAEGRACFELAQEFGQPENWFTSTNAALLKLGLIANSGRERFNPASGKYQRVLVAKC